MSHYNELVKVLLIGDEQVGKSCILHRFSDDSYSDQYISTIGVDFAVRALMTTGTNNFDSRPKKMQVWDTAGQERFRTITSSYYRGAQFVFVVYDITVRATFENIQTIWLNEVFKFAHESVQIALVGNKADLRDLRQVPTEEAAEWAASKNIQFIEVSAKDGQEEGRVLQLFQWAADASETTTKKLSPSVVEESTHWIKKILPFFDQFKHYKPLAKLTAPKLEDPNVQQWIEMNAQQLTPEVLTKMYHAVHLGTYDRKGVTVQQAVYLCLLGSAIGCDQLAGIALNDLERLRAETIDVMSVPKLIEDSSVVNTQLALTAITTQLSVALAADKRGKIPEIPKFEQQWRQLIGRLYDERDSTGDVTVIVEDKAYKAHKLVLIYNCDFFASCLMSNFIEADRAEVKLDNEVTIAAWESLLNYFYKFDMAHITDTNICLEILTCAPYLMLTSEAKSPVTHISLLKHCEDTAYNSITDETALELLLSAHQNEDQIARKVVKKYIINNYFRLLDTYESEFTKLPKPLMFSVLNDLILQTAKK